MKQIRKEILEENETGKMCSLSVGETGEMSSSEDADTCGDGCSFVQKNPRMIRLILSILLYTFFSRMFDLCCLLQ
jgi:hypothetical protein